MYYFRYSEELSTNKKNKPYISFGYKTNDNNFKVYDTITYFDNNMAEIKKDGISYVGMVPEGLSEEGKTVKVKFKFGDNIEEVTYNKNFNED